MYVVFLIKIVVTGFLIIYKCVINKYTCRKTIAVIFVVKIMIELLAIGFTQSLI